MSIRFKVIVAILVSLTIATVASVLVVENTYRRSVEVIATDELREAYQSFKGLEAEESEKLSIAASIIAQDPRVIDLVRTGDREGLQALCQQQFDGMRNEYGTTHWYFEETPQRGGRVIARIHKPELYGDRIDRETYRRAVDTGEGSGLDLGKTAFALRVVKPVRDEAGVVVGYVELGQEIAGFLDRMRDGYGGDYTLVVDKEALGDDAEATWTNIRSTYPNAGQWFADARNLVVDSTVRGAPVWHGDINKLPESGRVINTLREGDVVLVTAAFPVSDAAGKRIGAVVATTDVTELFSIARRAQVTIALTIAAVMAALGFGLVIVLNTLVFARLNGMSAEMAELMSKVAQGDYHVHYHTHGSTSDEIGNFEAFFARLVEAVGNLLEDPRRR